MDRPRYLLRLNLETLRSNLGRTAGTPPSDQDVLLMLAAMGVRRRDDDWFTAENTSFFLDGEVLEMRPFD
jgi:hypothetical protein